MTNDVRDRLRRAREAANMSRAELARRTGRAQSTIRAHESGQNNLQPEAAKAYAEALGVRPEWLLYAANPPPEKLTVTSDMFTLVDVVGVVRSGYFLRPDDIMEFPGPRQLVVPRFYFSRSGLTAYMDRSDVVLAKEQRRYLVVAPARTGYMRKGASVVLRFIDGQNTETGLWRVTASKERYGFQQLREGGSGSSISFLRGSELPENIVNLGVVVGRIDLSFERPSWEWDVRTTQRDLSELEQHHWELAREMEEEEAGREAARAAEEEADSEGSDEE